MEEMKITPLFYIDEHNQIKTEERQEGIRGRFSRAFSGRNYDLFDIWTTTVITPESATQLDTATLYKKFSNRLANELQSDSNEILGSIVQLSSILSGGKPSNEKVHDLLSLCKAKNSHGLEILEKIEDRFASSEKIKEIIHQVITRCKSEAEWKQFNLPKHFLTKFPEEIDFLYKSGLLPTIVGLQNSTERGKTQHRFKIFKRPKSLKIKCEGKWKSVKTIAKELEWNDELKTLQSRKNPAIKWNYFAEGLVPVDRFYRIEANKKVKEEDIPLKPIAQLSNAEYKKLLDNATGFQFEKDINTKILESTEKAIGIKEYSPSYASAMKQKRMKQEKLIEMEPKYVIQFVTYPAPIETDPMKKNMTAQQPVECGIRFITPEGKVFSTGKAAMEGTATLEAENFAQKKEQLMSGHALDFQEHSGRLVTNLAISETEALEIMKSWTALRFSAKRLETFDVEADLLSRMGINLNMKINPREVIYRSLPNLSDLPVIGKPLAGFKGRIVRIGTGVSKTLLRTADKLPLLVKQYLGNYVAQLLSSVKSTIDCVIDVILFLFLSGDPDKVQQTKSYGTMLGDMANQDDPLSHLPILVHWQLEQKNSQFYSYKGVPNLNIVPEDEQSIEAKKHLAELKDQYQYALPTIPVAKKESSSREYQGGSSSRTYQPNEYD